jgi:hypothetical protein
MKPDEQLYFIHIPKTAGTTLISLLDSHFATEEICPAQLWRELLVMPAEEIPRYRLYRGHFGGAGLSAFLPRAPLCMTMLRKPLALTISRYQFVWRESGSRLHEMVRGQGLSLAEFLENPVARASVANAQVRNLALELDPVPTMGCVLEAPSQSLADQWLRDHRRVVTLEQKFEGAKKRLESCVFFGLVERFEESMQLLSYTFGWLPPRRIQRLKVAPSNSGDATIAAGLEQIIQNFSRFDLELYAFAEEVFQRRLAFMRRRLRVFERASQLPVAETLDQHYTSCWEKEASARGKCVQLNWDEPLRGRGWHRREQSAVDGTTFRWLGPDTTALLDFDLEPGLDYRLTFGILDHAGKEILDGLRLFVSGQEVTLQRVLGRALGDVRQAHLPARILRARRFTRLEFRVHRTVSFAERRPGADDPRKLSVALNWLDLQPASLLRRGELPTAAVTQRESWRRSLQWGRRLLILAKDWAKATPWIGPRVRVVYHWSRFR